MSKSDVIIQCKLICSAKSALYTVKSLIFGKYKKSKIGRTFLAMFLKFQHLKIHTLIMYEVTLQYCNKIFSFFITMLFSDFKFPLLYNQRLDLGEERLHQ